jgi:uncharacterized membrane protein YkoI
MMTRSTITGSVRTLLTALAMASVLGWALSAAPSRAAGEVCFADWSEAAPIIRDNALTPATELKSLLRNRIQGELVKITLCQQADGVYIYKLVVLQGSGQVTNLTVDARDPMQP